MFNVLFGAKVIKHSKRESFIDKKLHTFYIFAQN